MYSREAIIRNKSGLHARPAAEFVTCALRSKSWVKIKNLTIDSKAVNAKSAVLILTISLSTGHTALISAEGPDETETVDSLCALIAGGFGEM